MSEEQPTQPAPDQPAPGSSPTPEAERAVVARREPEAKGGRSPIGMFAAAIGVMIGVVLIVTLVGIVIALADPGAAGKIGAVRDIFIIVLAWFSILIALSLVILVLQVAALVNLIKNEVIPILESLQQTADTVRGTARFMGKNLAQPVIGAQGLFAAIRRLLELFRLMNPKAEPMTGFEEYDDVYRER